MTRKEELEELADKIVCSTYSRVDDDGDMSTVQYTECVQYCLEKLKQVEREVWADIVIYLNSRGALWSQLGKDQKVEACKDILEWCREQQKGVER